MPTYHLEKEGPIRRKGLNPHQKDRTNSHPKNDWPTAPREGRAKHHPREARANPFREGPTFKSNKGQTLHGKKEWRTSPSLARRKGQFPTPRRKGQPEPQEGRANPNKEGSTITPEEKQPPRRANPHTKRQDQFPPEERQVNLQPREGKTKPHPPKKGEQTKRAKKEATSTKACQPSTPDRIASATSCVTPGVKIENLKLVPDQTTPRIENASAIAIKLHLQFELQLRLQFRLVV